MREAGCTSSDENTVINRGGSFSKTIMLAEDPGTGAEFKAAIRQYPDNRYCDPIMFTAELGTGTSKRKLDTPIQKRQCIQKDWLHRGELYRAIRHRRETKRGRLHIRCIRQQCSTFWWCRPKRVCGQHSDTQC